MAMLIRGGTVINHDHSRRADVLIEAGKIVAVAEKGVTGGLKNPKVEVSREQEAGTTEEPAADQPTAPPPPVPLPPPTCKPAPVRGSRRPFFPHVPLP